MMNPLQKSRSIKFLFIFSLVLACAYSSSVYALQFPISTCQNLTVDSVCKIPDKMPRFPGGDKGLLDFLTKNVRYPLYAQQKRIEGKVILQFIINAEGKVEKVSILRGVCPSINKEAMRVVNSMPDWIPGELNGKKIAVYYTLPVSFKLEEEYEEIPGSEQ
jgi:TonB family protein